MAELIPVVEQASGPVTWSDSVTISGHTDVLTFRVAGGTFSNNTSQMDITPTGSVYAVSLKATITVDETTTQPVVVYYKDGDNWMLVHSASRIFTVPRKKTLDYRFFTQGVDAMPLGASLNPTYNGLVIGGGVRNPTQAELQQSPVVKISDLAYAPFDLTKRVSFVYDRQAKTLYCLYTNGAVVNTKIFSALTDVDLAHYHVTFDSTGKRTGLVLIHRDGHIDILDEALTSTADPIQLGYKVNRVVYRRANFALNGTADSYVVFDRDGAAHYLDASFNQTKVLTDKFYVNASDGTDMLATASGELIGFVSDNGSYVPPSNVLWFQFPTGSTAVLGYDVARSESFPDSARALEIRWSFAGTGSRNSNNGDRLFYWSDGAWTDAGYMSKGMCTDGTDALVSSLRGSDVATPTRNGWPVLSLFNAPYTDADQYDRLFYYAARPTNNLKHIDYRNYNTVWPNLADVELGPTVSFTLTVQAEDPDLPLAISAPAGVSVSATVGGKPVTRVFNGDEVTVTLSHAYITGTSFPVAIGRTVYQFETKIDDTPNAFKWENIVGVENDTWTRTEDVTISGINVTVPITVLVDGEEATDERVKIFVDGVETAQPAVIRNGQTLGFEVLQQNNTTKISVEVGKTSSSFGVYTIVEPVLNVGRHWAYAPIGKPVRSDVIRNTGTSALVLTITDTDAKFVSGGKTVTVPANGTAQIEFTPTENIQYTVKFSTEQHNYEWYVWADKVWLGDVPQTKRAERYVMADSGDIFFDNIPDNFWTYITVPAGLLLDVDGNRVVQELDVRGVYKNQGLVVGPFECADTMLKIYGLPSHDQPHTLMLGNAPLPWLYDMTVDPTYEWGEQTAQFVDQHYIAAHTENVTSIEVEYATKTDSANYIDLFEFEDASVTLAEPLVRNFVAPAFDAETVAGPAFDTGQKDFVDNFRMADLIARSDIVVTDFDLFELMEGTEKTVTDMPLFELVEGKKDVVETTPLMKPEAVVGSNGVTEFDLFEMTQGTEHAVTDMPLFELTQGTEHTVTDMPLFEATLGQKDSVAEFPLFEMTQGSKAVADAFVPEFDAHFSLEAAWDSFEIAAPRYVKQTLAVAPKTEGKYRPEPGLHHVPAAPGRKVDHSYVVVEGARPQYVKQPGLYAADTALPVYVSTSTTYHIDPARPQWMPSVVTYQVKAVVGKYVDPVYHPAVIFMPEIPFVRFHTNPVYYHVGPAASDWQKAPQKYLIDPSRPQFYQLKLVADSVVPHSIAFKATAPAYLASNEGIKHVPTAAIGHPEAAPPIKVVSANAVRAKVSAPKTTARPVVRAKVPTARKATSNSAVRVKGPVFETWTATPNHGTRDEPLKEGYFATELEALQNATQVWGFDASAVYAIEQPNGAWTWAQVTVCDSACGSMSCSARGYMSGG
ncbi:hypothetical protein pEaSNUABM34_00156 [Erwinia phage pEa_SNUABM_34]|nr:hypothetical protein pEaSNUABM34_00156 [Erwinia phage pEa_SNUABM_34]